MYKRLAAVRVALGKICEEVDFDVVCLADAKVLMAEAATTEKLAGDLKSRAAARVADLSPKRGGRREAARLLAKTQGSGLRAAEDAIETQAALALLPATAAAARSGELSSAQTKQVAAGASADPDAEEQLLELARRGSLTELANESARVRAAADRDAEARRARLFRLRSLRSWLDAQGLFHLELLHTPEAGGRIRAILAPFVESERRRAASEGRMEREDVLEADAFVEMTEAAVADEDDDEPENDEPEDDEADGEDEPESDDEPEDDEADEGGGGPHDDGPGTTGPGTTDGGPHDDGPGTTDGGPNDDGPHDDGPAPDGDGPRSGRNTRSARGGRPARSARRSGRGAKKPRPAQRKRPRDKRRRQVPVKIIVRIDLPAWVRGYATSGEVCEILGIGPVAVSAVTDMLECGDPFLACVVTDGVKVAGVVNYGRRPNAHQQTALEFLQPECCVLGCATRSRLEFDHREDWAATHMTVVDLIDRLCARHHALKTHRHWALVEGVGKRDFVPPEDPRHPRHGKSPPPRDPPSDPDPGASPAA